MSETHLALQGYVAWTLILSFAVPAFRYSAQIFEGRAANSFKPDGSDLSPIGHRFTRAAGNSAEWLAVPVTLLMYAIVTEQTPLTDGLALVALAARIAQSTVHLVSTAPMAVQIRGVIFGFQVLIWCFWLVRLFTGS